MGHRIAWKVAAGSEAPPPPSGVRIVRPLLRELLPRPPPGPTTAPRTPAATEEVGSLGRHGPLELSCHRGAPRPPSSRSVRPGEAGGGKKKVNPKEERKKERKGDQKGEASVPLRTSCPSTAQATKRQKVQGCLEPIFFCAWFLPDSKMKGQNLALTLAALMATCAISAASPGEKTMRA